MRKAFAMSAFALMITIVLAVQWYSVNAGQDRGAQILDEYGKQNGSRDQVKFHLALKLFTGDWNDTQRQLILKAINAPSRELEGEISAAFTRDAAVDVFYKIGSADIADLRAVYSLPIGKSEMYRAMTVDRQRRLWQMNFALGFVRYDLNADQQQYLLDLGAALPLTREQSVAWEERAVKLFSRDIGRGLFATIGEARCPGQLAAAGRLTILPTCVCTTKSGNWSCNDSCQGEGSCSLDAGNCGFLWLYDCNGMCDNREA